MPGRRPRLWSRLFLSYLIVVAAGAAVTIVTVRLLTPRLFDDQVLHEPSGPGRGAGGPSMRAAVVSALNSSLAIATAISLAIAVIVAWFVTRRIIRPIDDVRATTRALAGGDYRQRVVPPREVELAALAHDLNVLAASLEHTEQRRQHLVTELAHELRTPITTIAGFLDGFLDGVIEPTPEAFAELTGEVRRLERLTADLGLLSRLDEGSLPLQVESTQLGDVAHQVVSRLRPQFDASDIVLIESGGPAPVRADPDRLAQILTNLIGNALRYSSPGGRVAVTWSSDANDAWCAVDDTGSGLSADELDTIFDRFTRGSASAGRSGSGVGLTIARSLARAHRGDITATSPGPGRGARFTLRLPIDPTPDSGTPPPA